MKIKDFFKKFFPASSNTFNSKTDRLTDLMIQINNDRLYTKDCIETLSNSFEIFVENCKKDHYEMINDISVLNKNVAELNKLCCENMKALDDALKCIGESLRNISDVKEIVTDSSMKTKNDILHEIDSSREQVIKASEKKTSNGNCNDIGKHLWDLAARQSAKYVTKHMAKCFTYPNPDKMRESALSMVEIDGLYIEFGVYKGRTINHAAKLKPNQRIYGFDSFEGLPDTWRTGFYKNIFATSNLPEVCSNVELVVGYFEDTLPAFLEEHPENCAYIHVDCDIYSSAKTVFRYLKDRIVSGTIIVFDEYFNYPSWKEHEFKAFREFVSENNIKYDYIGYVPNFQQVFVKII